MNTLEKIRLSEGPEKCVAVFQQSLRKNQGSAAKLLSGSGISYPTLFILLPSLERTPLALPPRLSGAVSITKDILKPGTQKSRNTGGREAMAWMLKTGFDEHSLGGAYRKVMDITASELINTYKDLSALPPVADMIFQRHRLGYNYHDLVWAYFCSHSPEAMRLVAEHLKIAEDCAFACELLGIEGEAECGQRLYDEYMSQLRENDPYLYFTGESMQEKSAPVFCEVDMERKYLGRGFPQYEKQPTSPADEREEKALAGFRLLAEKEQRLLSYQSNAIRQKDSDTWKAWLETPVSEQLKTAGAMKEGEKWLL